ncbi:unnamed protein product, partial [Closterium sp. NIES-53]
GKSGISSRVPFAHVCIPRGLNSAGLTGPIPPSLGALTKLASLVLGENQLEGSIPASLGNLVNLTNLVLQRNSLTGSIPSTFEQLTRLSYLGINDNSLTGSIPALFESLFNLQELSVSAFLAHPVIPAVELPAWTFTWSIDTPHLLCIIRDVTLWHV